ncbi:MAG: putative glycoside hydrolase [Candidatus Paceibacterota bacterium]|jgi:hypothetical protein
MKVRVLLWVLLGAALLGLFLFLAFSGPRVIDVKSSKANVLDSAEESLIDLELQTNIAPTSTSSSTNPPVLPTGVNSDIPNQPQLASPPAVIKSVYATGWSAGSASQINHLVDLINQTELNAIIIDIKDYSGFVSYHISSPLIQESGADKEIRILQPNILIKRLHDNGIYVIARISTFQDGILAVAHPEWALKDKTTGKIWRDNKGLAWMDPTSKNVWDYNIAIARDALSRGFDEINFDYVRFPSDGGLSRIEFPVWDQKKPMDLAIKDFFKYLRENLGQAKLSADLFGLTTVDYTDLGIGQIIENAFPYFDYIDPMVYPSHYASGAFGLKKPALYPYEVVKNSITVAVKRLIKYNQPALPVTSSSIATSTPKIKEDYGVRAKIRPWLQDFDLGMVYDAKAVRAQITASDEGGGSGWMLWDPRNVYTREALLTQ